MESDPKTRLFKARPPGVSAESWDRFLTDAILAQQLGHEGPHPNDDSALPSWEDLSKGLTSPAFVEEVLESALMAAAAHISQVELLQTLDPTFDNTETLGPETFASADSVEITSSPMPKERYELLDVLGTGGTSRVWHAHDRILNRSVALKILLRDQSNPALLALESRVTGSLEHPSILPVYDVYVDEKGSACYTMRVAQERSLSHLIKDEANLGPRRACNILRQVALAVHYAHERGVVHRDVKPDNILIGSYGEVYLTDWGVAFLMDSHPDAALVGDSPAALVGTPMYMAPEQINAGRIDARTDVYALGATLYHALCGRPPFRAKTLQELFARIQVDESVAPSSVAPHRQIPDELDAVCLMALKNDPERRFQTARQFAEAVESFLEGDLDRTRRRAAYDVAMEQAKQTLAICRQSQKTVALLRERCDSERPRLTASSTSEQRHDLWSLEEKLAAAEIGLETAFAKVVTICNEALVHLPGNVVAKRMLSRLYWERFEDEEASGDAARAAYYMGLVHQNDDGTYAALLGAPALLTIKLSEPASLQVWLDEPERYRIRREKLFERATSTRHRLSLNHGSYRLIFQRKGSADVVLHKKLTRATQQTLAVDLPKADAIPDGFAAVPSLVDGRCVFTAMKVTPVTCGEYLEFLNDLAINDLQVALAHAPRVASKPYVTVEEDGTLTLLAPDPEGDTWEEDWPVLMVSYDDAVAFARWKSLQSSMTFRVPSAEEWLRAARGDDHRKYPWGNAFDTSLCHMRDSQPGRPKPAKVGSYPSDISPYGVKDVAGNIAEWTSTQVSDGVNVVQGAAFNSLPVMCRLDHAMSAPRSTPLVHLGFRLLAEL